MYQATFHQLYKGCDCYKKHDIRELLEKGVNMELGYNKRCNWVKVIPD